MNVLHKVSLASLKENRVRTIVTVLGVALAAALVTGVITTISSFLDYGRRNAIYYSGDWYAKYIMTDGSQIETVQSDDRVEEVFYSQQIGYAELERPAKKKKPYICVLGCDQGFFANMTIRLTSGRLPEREGEIILPDHLLDANYDTEIGDSITLELGYRVFKVTYDAAAATPDPVDDKCRDSSVLDQDSPFMTDDGVLGGEVLVDRRTVTYTVVGTYAEPGFENSNTPGYTALTVPDGNARDDVYNIYFRTKNPFDIYDVTSELETKITVNKNSMFNGTLLMIYGVWSAVEFYSIVLGITTILVGLVVIGSTMLIRNAFAISVSERTRMFGLLASIGATPRQLRASVRFEALCITVIGVPLGMVAGAGLSGAVIWALSDLLNRIMDDPNGAIGVKLVANPFALALAAAICVATVLLSARHPARRAIKLSPIDAIRQSEDIKLTRRDVKPAKLTSRLFGTPGILAARNSGRNKKRRRATVTSLCLSVVLFVTASALGEYLQISMSQTVVSDWDVEAGVSAQSLSAGDELYEQILEQVDYDDLFAFAELSYATIITNSDTVDKIDALSNLMTPVSDGKTGVYASFCVIGDDDYLEFLNEHNLDPEKFLYSDQITAVVCDTVIRTGYTGFKATKYDIFKADEFTFEYGYSDSYIQSVTITVDGEQMVANDVRYPAAVTLRAGAVVDTAPWGLKTGNTVYVLLPRRMAELITGDNIFTEGGFGFYFHLKTADHVKTAKQLQTVVDDSDLFGASVIDSRENSLVRFDIVGLISLFGVIFSLLVSLIAAANVFNTVSTSVLLRRRELAMLTSVGISRRDYYRMLALECLFYGVKALLWGLPLSAAASYLVYVVLAQGFAVEYFIPWIPVAAAIAGVFAIVFAAMLYAASKLRAGNTLDMLRSENV